MKLINWHHLFGITLTDYFADTAYTVELEKDLSLKKQLLDIVIIEKKEGQMPDEIADGLENMAAHNLLSYKSFWESFDEWSADELVGHYVNYRKQVSPSLKKLLPKKDFRLYAVCTRFPGKLEKEDILTKVKDGIYDLRWGIRDIRLIVTSQIAKEKRNAMWLMFSAVRDRFGYGASNYRGKLDEMSSAMEDLFIKYKTEGIIEMSYTLEDYRKGLKERTLAILTPEERLEGLSSQERLKGLSADEIFRSIPTEERLKGLSTDEILRGLSTDEIMAYLKKLPRKAKPKKKG